MSPMAQQEWARDLVIGHLARSALKVPHLAARPGWRRLGSPEVIEFILNGRPGITTSSGMEATGRVFGDLAVLVSVPEVVSRWRLQLLLPGGYLASLERMVLANGIDYKNRDIAHWVLCKGKVRTAAHLSYGAGPGNNPLMPWDLLSAAERRAAPKPI